MSVEATSNHSEQNSKKSLLNEPALIKLNEYQMINTPVGRALTFYLNNKQIEQLAHLSASKFVYFQVLNQDIEFYTDNEVSLVLEGGAKLSNIKKTPMITLIAIEPLTGSIALDIDSQYQVKH
jgi:hypothetical protein